MSRLSRLEEYADPMRGPHGSASDAQNLKDWSDEATRNSKIAPRASDGPMNLPSTKVNVRDSAMAPKVSRNVDRAMRGKNDLNHVSDGSDYMKSIRREA
jgi:hypothetical protein